jgi:cytochrome c oxidase subunit II
VRRDERNGDPPGRLNGRLGVAVGFLAPVLFVTCRGDQSALDPASPEARDVATLWWVLFAISAVVVAAVTMLVLVASLRRPGALGRRWGGMGLVVVGGVIVPFLILVVVFVITVATLPSVSAPPRGEARLTVDVIGRQFWWEVRYPDPGFVTANEIHIPTDTPVELRVRTGDVIHSLWVPRLSRKIDMIPGRTNRILIRADAPGVYRGQCAEFCGLAHAQMAFLVIAETPDRFAGWISAQAGDAAAPVEDEAAQGQEVFLSSSCVACHTIRGTEATATVGPDLTHLAGRRWLGAGTVPNTRGNLGGWIVDPQRIKPGNRMPPTSLSGPELQALLDYLETLE